MTLTVMDWFCGAGGSSQGIDAVPGVEVTLAANHWQLAIDSHASNFPRVRHERGDIRDLPVHRWPVATGFWASPECKKWTGARGKKRDYAAADTPLPGLPGLQPTPPEEDERSRALMWDVPKYLEGVQRRGKLVLFGVVENVVEARTGRDWDRWLRDFHHLGYKTRLIAFNSMHAQHTRTPRSPQSRDRLYLAYWHTSLGRDPDFDKWLRPQAYCPGCDRTVQAIQVFKNPRRDMGRYRQSYLYRCPSTTCRNTPVEPETLPALAAIDPAIPAGRIGDRPKTPDKPHGLRPATIDRITAGITTYWLPLLNSPHKHAEALTLPPFLVPLRGGGDKERARPATAPLNTVSAEGNHHGYVPPHLLVPYYGTSKATTADRPIGALTTRDRYGIATLPHTRPDLAIDDVCFRMLEPSEVARAMAFTDGYTVLGTKSQRVRQYGNAVTPPVAELLTSALAETVTGEDLDRHPDQTWSIAA
ncbi:DNA cytosine methyltransferase [Streptomyces albus]|uniref:DNA cytosine methyltransferase n=1 Tax=Streptomyces sp. NRRL F-5639 TaxID=1463867 RepID=UPI000567F12B|nr:DNA cytosine methyltransferase [Streptomyces sp. NRRL F-5639]